MKNETLNTDKNLKKSYKLLFFLVGLAITALAFLPYIINGRNSVITYHDQLDGEILTYIFNAKYLFSKTDIIPELMNGMSKNAFVPPAPAMILIYKAFSPFMAFMICLFIAKITAFSSMYFLLFKLFDRWETAIVGAVLFMLIPFYSVYGLCIPGIPLVLYSFLLIKDKKYILSVLLTFVYGINSSLALVGFAMIIVTALIAFYEAVKEKNYKAFLIPAFLTVTYSILNINLVMQILAKSEEFVSHKSEVVYQPMSFLQAVDEIFVKGVSYAQSNQVCLIPMILLGLVVLAITAIKTRKVKEKIKTDEAVLLASCISIVAITLVYIMLESPVVISLKNQSSGIFHEFNFTRFSWLMPVAWILAFSSSMNFVIRKIEKAKKKKVKQILFSVILVACTFLCMFGLLDKSDIKPNVARIKAKGNYHMVTWNQFFCEDVFEIVDGYTDDDKSSYRVASIGIYPSIAAYNGYYCLDAYSNNYDVEYKHEFRKIIEKELDKNDYIRQNFDEWGNRCYLFNATSGTYALYEKEYMDAINELDFDYGQMKKMGCKYIFSTHYILNEEDNLKLLNEEAVMTDESWFKLWIYEIK